MADLARVFRLHVGGISALVGEDDLRKKFSGFGDVIRVDGVGKLDANGCPLKYGFVEIRATESQVKRCMNLLSGSTYRGGLMRIAVARPDYRARREQELSGSTTRQDTQTIDPATEGEQDKKARGRRRKLANGKANKKGIEGYDASGKMDVMNLVRFRLRDRTKGWKKDPITSLPIFPLITRPTHPIPSGGKVATFPQSPHNVSTVGAPLTRPPTRARRVIIDPTLYHAAMHHRKAHLLGARPISIQQFKLGFSGGSKEAKKKQASQMVWECHGIEGNGMVVWKLKSGEAFVGEEKVALSDFTVHKLLPQKDEQSQYCGVALDEPES